MPEAPKDREVALVLAGGNALGAYHLGVAEALREAGVEPGMLVGCSIGAVTGAILAGNAPEDRLDRLRAFWRTAAQPDHPAFGARDEEARARRGTEQALSAFLFGRPGLFGHRMPGPWSMLPLIGPDVALRDHAPLARTLERLIDFDRLNRGEPTFRFVALDMETGEEVWFDNRRDRIEPRALLAATALAPLFPPVEIEGRLLCDAGFANNLPVDDVFREPPARDLLCIAADLFDLRGARPRGLSGAAARAQDLMFASQTRRAIDSIGREQTLRRRLDPDGPSATLAHLAYRAPGHERGTKALDYSRASLAQRAERGRADMQRMLPRLESANAHFTYLFEPEADPPDGPPASG